MTLIAADDLHRLLENPRGGEPRVRAVDLRWYLGRPGEGRAAYERGHVPGAIHLDLDADLSGPDGPARGLGRHPLPDPAEFAGRLAALGIGTDDLVVGYDDAGGWVAARLWWMLDTLGHDRTAVLDGGLQAWVSAGFGLSTVEPDWEPADLRLADRWTGTIDRDELRARLGGPLLLDARAPARYRGETEPVDPVAGHIPTALSAPWDGNVDGDLRLLPPDVLREHFEALGATADRAAAGEVVPYCGSGTSACHHALAMRVAGLPDPTIYVGSYSDWSRSGLPIATGPEPGGARRR